MSKEIPIILTSVLVGGLVGVIISACFSMALNNSTESSSFTAVKHWGIGVMGTMLGVMAGLIVGSLIVV